MTGANSGIGKATAAGIVKLQGRVIMACRDLDKAEEAARDIQQGTGAESTQLVVKRLDLASLTSVRAFCEDVIKVAIMFLLHVWLSLFWKRLSLGFIKVLCGPVKFFHTSHTFIDLVTGADSCWNRKRLPASGPERSNPLQLKKTQQQKPTKHNRS